MSVNVPFLKFVLSVFLALTLLPACPLYSCARGPIQQVNAAKGEKITDEIKVFYATNRKVDGASYGTSRNYALRDQGINYGMVLVNMKQPKQPEVGKPTTLSRDEFYRTLRGEIDHAKSKEAAVFIHGYNNGFIDAMNSGTLLSAKLACPVIVFDWCSQHKLKAYPVDECNIEWSLRHFQLLMQGIETEFDPSKVVIVSHSMGNRVVYWYLQSRFDSQQSQPKKFAEIVLTSPDVDRATFKNYFYKVANNAELTRIYVSAHDKPLRFSRFIHLYERLGDGRPVGTEAVKWELPGFIKGTSTINFTNLDKKTGLLGHSIQFGLIGEMHRTGLPGPGFELKEDPDYKGEYLYVRKALPPLASSNE